MPTTITTGDRCSGHCCARFFLPYGPEELQARAPGLTDGEQIAAMVIHLGESDRSPGTGLPTRRHHQYTCRNYVNGGCAIYTTRPRMCSEFPYGKPCEYTACTWTKGREGAHPPAEGLELVQLRTRTDATG